MTTDNRPLMVVHNTAGFCIRADQFDRAKSVLNMSYVLAQSGVAVPLTGTAAETTLASCTVPGGLMGPNGALRVYAVFSCTGSVNAKTLRFKLGGVDISGGQQITAATTVQINKLRMVHNRGNEASQIAYSNWVEFGANNAAALFPAVNTAVDQPFLITGQLASAAETLTLEAFSLEVLPT